MRKIPTSPSIKRVLITTVGCLSLFLVGVGVGAAGHDSTAAPKETATRTIGAPPVTVTVTDSAPPKIITQTVQPPQETAFSDGVWLVGTDIKPGTYRTKDVVSGSCYWKIAKPGSDNIIQNDMVSGGRPTVVLKAGQEFTSQDCGDWTKTR